MDNEDEISVRALAKLETEGSISTLYLLTLHEEGVLTLKASDGKQLWQGVFYSAALESMAKKAKLSIKVFMEQTLHALTQCGNEPTTFAVSANINSSDDLSLAWKRHIVEENVKFQIACVTLAQSPSTVSPMLEFAVDNISHLKEDINSLTKMVDNLKKERSTALEKLGQCAALKEDLESDLYGKFKLLLNDKKAKIRLLNEQAKALAEENQKLKDMTITSVTKSRTKKNKIEYDSEGTTDDEAVSTDRKRSRTPSPVSKIAVEDEESVDVSSLLGSKPEKISSPPVKRRRAREVKKPPKQPVFSKPVETKLKKVVASSKPTRSSSNASSHSSLEADDLLDKM